jgi:hypothetical protein
MPVRPLFGHDSDVIDEAPSASDLLDAWRDAVRAAELAARLTATAARAVEHAAASAAAAAEMSRLADETAAAAGEAATQAKAAYRRLLEASVSP